MHPKAGPPLPGDTLTRFRSGQPMNPKLIIPLIASAGLALSACGSGSSAGSHPASRGPGRPVRTYHVVLTGKGLKPAGAPQGAGGVVLALHHRAVVCYRFAHLRGLWQDK